MTTPIRSNIAIIMQRNSITKKLKIAVVLLILIFVISYAVFNSRIFIAGPQIHIESPQNGALISDSPLIHIKGNVENIAYLRLNGREIYTDESGVFEEALLLSNGYNIIQLVAKDRFDREEMAELQIVYSGEEIDFEERFEEAAPVGTTTLSDELDSVATSTPEENSATTSE